MCKRKTLLSIGDCITFFVITQNYAGIIYNSYLAPVKTALNYFEYFIYSLIERYTTPSV